MSSNTIKSQIKPTGIASVPLWIIGGFFLYILASVDLSVVVNNKASLTAKSMADISNVEKRIPRHNVVNILQRPLILAKGYHSSPKFDHHDDNKKFTLTYFSNYGWTVKRPIAFEKNLNIGFIKYVFAATQRAPPILT